MADKYVCFAELAARERTGHDYRVRFVVRASPLVVLAPHGGGIETGTSELAERVAGSEHSLFVFEGLKPWGNRDLHITSEPGASRRCRAVTATRTA